MKKSPAHLVLASSGSYPRTGSAPEMLALEETAKAFESGERTTADLVDAQNAMSRRAISEQVAAGLDIVTDGQVRWRDPISHIPSALDNVRLDGSHPFFATSQKYRQPVLMGRPTRRGPLVAHEFSFACNALGHLPTPKGKAGKLSIKPVLIGPYTLAKFSSADSAFREASESYSSLEHRVEAFADALAAEIKALIEAGAELIQIDEPAAASSPADFPLVASGISALVAARNSAAGGFRRASLALYLYFGDAAPLYDQLQDLPVDILGLDFVANPKLSETVSSSGSAKTLALGFLCGQNPDLEDPQAIAREIERLLPLLPSQRAHLGPSCGLGFLSHEAAAAKLALLPKIQQLVLGQA